MGILLGKIKICLYRLTFCFVSCDTYFTLKWANTHLMVALYVMSWLKNIHHQCSSTIYIGCTFVAGVLVNILFKFILKHSEHKLDITIYSAGSKIYKHSYTITRIKAQKGFSMRTTPILRWKIFSP